MLSHVFQPFCSLKMGKSICSLTTVSLALIESVCWALLDMEKPLAQLLLVNPWLAAKCLWASCWGVPFPYSCPLSLCPLTLAVVILFRALPAVISLRFAGTSLPLPWASLAAFPPRVLSSQPAPLG